MLQGRNKNGVNTGLRHTIGKKHKSKEDIVYLVGMYSNCVLYVAKISEIIEMRDYSKKYKNRRDNIYDFSTSGEGKRNKTNILFHPADDKNQHIRDLSGKYALISNKYRYFGKDYKNHSISKELLEYLPKKQEFKVFSKNDIECFDLIVNLINESLKCNNYFEPITKLENKKQKACYQK